MCAKKGFYRSQKRLLTVPTEFMQPPASGSFEIRMEPVDRPAEDNLEVVLRTALWR
jgi:hypothetical protein